MLVLARRLHDAPDRRPAAAAMHVVGAASVDAPNGARGRHPAASDGAGGPGGRAGDGAYRVAGAAVMTAPMVADKTVAADDMAGVSEVTRAAGGGAVFLGALPAHGGRRRRGPPRSAARWRGTATGLRRSVRAALNDKM